MTGTALTEADEFRRDLQAGGGGDPHQRARSCESDDDDEVYRTATEKYESVAKLIDESRGRKHQPVLVGTTSIEKSETASASC